MAGQSYRLSESKAKLVNASFFALKLYIPPRYDLLFGFATDPFPTKKAAHSNPAGEAIPITFKEELVSQPFTI